MKKINNSSVNQKDRIVLPGMIDYVLRENVEQKEQDKHNNKVRNADKVIYEDRELAA